MILESDSSPLPTGKITTYEASWVASLVNAGGVFGTLFFGPIANKFGRKNPLIVITIPTIVSHSLFFYRDFLIMHGCSKRVDNIHFPKNLLHFSFVGLEYCMRRTFIICTSHDLRMVSLELDIS